LNRILDVQVDAMIVKQRAEMAELEDTTRALLRVCASKPREPASERARD
jgi:hypothetical protein